MSNIFGNIADISRYARQVNGIIELINGPISEDPLLITTTKKVFRTDATGYFSVELGAGDYTLKVGTDNILFSVLLNEGDFNILTLIRTDLTYPQQPYASNWNGLRQGHIQFIFCPEPAIPALAVSFTDTPTGLQDAEVYNYAVSYLTSTGETKLTEIVSAADEHMNPDGGPYGVITIPLEVNPTGGVTKKRIWRNTADGAETLQLLAEVDPSVASYDDRESFSHFLARIADDPDAYPAAPTENTTAGGLYAGNVLVARINALGLLIVGGVPQSVSFERSDAVHIGEYIGGRTRYATNSDLKSACLICRNRPLTGSVVIALELDGTVNLTKFFTITPGAGEYEETIDLTGILLERGVGLRWKVIDATDVSISNPTDQSDYPSGISLTSLLNTYLY